MKLGTEVGLSPGHIMLDGDPAPPNARYKFSYYYYKRGIVPQFSAHVCCGQTVGWIKIPLGTEVGLGPGYIVLAGTQLP